MGNMPLHPIVVHFPLVLAILLPVVILALIWGQRRRGYGRRAWWIVTALAALLAVTTVLSVKTGEADEERVERVVSEAVIHEHEERAELFQLGAIAFLVLTLALPVVRSPRIRAGFVAGTTGASILIAALAIAVGHSGGTLVYEHDAAAAFSGTQIAGSDDRTYNAPERDREKRDDDERGRHQ